MNLDRISTLEPEWAALVETIAAMITLAPEYVVIQTYSATGEEDGPYIQTLQESDGALTLEAVSDSFIPGIVVPDALNTLHELGWSDPEEYGLPNYSIFLESEDVHPGDVAAFLVLTLRDAYSITTSHRFECAPMELFVQVVHGEFGQAPGLTFTPFDISEWRKRHGS